MRQRNKVRIKTKYQKRDVLFREYYPSNEAERAIFKYACPVCLLYFNHILVSSCCQNYICRFCIGDLAKKAKRDSEFVIRCTHCMTDDYKLNDVDPSSPLKLYTDTPKKFRTPETTGDNDNHVTPDAREFNLFGKTLRSP